MTTDATTTIPDDAPPETRRGTDVCAALCDYRQRDDRPTERRRLDDWPTEALVVELARRGYVVAPMAAGFEERAAA